MHAERNNCLFSVDHQQYGDEASAIHAINKSILGSCGSTTVVRLTRVKVPQSVPKDIFHFGYETPLEHCFERIGTYFSMVSPLTDRSRSHPNCEGLPTVAYLHVKHHHTAV